MNNAPHAPRLNHRHAGFGALAVMLLLLFGSSIAVFYLNRGLIFEQKTSANQLRSTTAFEVAEAGLEWATGMLNSPQEITAACALTSSVTTSFRAKYVGTSAVAPATATYPGCKISGTTVSCHCPDVAGGGAETTATTTNVDAASAIPATALPGFTVSFSDVGDSQAVRVTATGCTAQAGVCKPLTATAATTGNSDAWAQVSVILKLRPLLRAAPTAALTCGAACDAGGSYDIINTDVASNGYLVNAGTNITLQGGNGAQYVTIPGQPLENAMIANDDSLTALAASGVGCSNSSFFRAFFGTTIAEYRASPQVITINCGSGSCNTLVESAYNAGWRNFYFPAANGVQLTGTVTLGTSGAGNGVNIVSEGDIQTSGQTTIYGMVYGNNASLNYNGTGSANIIGAMVTCNNYSSNGNGTLTYDAGALGGTGLRPGVMVRVPGSWRDFTP